MAKDPAFLFYPGDWQGGTATFSRFLKGCYMDVLIAQFNSGPLSLEEIKTVLGSDFGTSWPTLQKKFKTDNSGSFFNERLETEKKKRKEYSKSRSENRKGNSTYDGTYEKHMSRHMENENGNRDNNGFKKGGKGGKKQRPTVEDVLIYYKTDIAAQFPNLEFSVQTKYETWVEQGWKDGNGKKIINWKTKLKSTIPYLKPTRPVTTDQQNTFEIRMNKINQHMQNTDWSKLANDGK